jgi:hypothetical protein
LRTFALRIVPSPGEDGLLTCGARLVRACPRLTTFTLVFLAHAPPLGRGPSWSRPVRAHAKFTLTTDGHGLPRALHVVERRARRPRRLWLWLGGTSTSPWPAPESVRRTTVDMRPAGAPGTRRPPFPALVLERSHAGEEVRLLLFCAALLAIVIWGCIRL